MANGFKYNPAELDIKKLMAKRPTVGNDVPVFLWKLIRVVGFHQILEEETPIISYYTGKKIGEMLKIKTIDQLKKELTDLKIGKINFPLNTSDQLHMEVGECMTCHGIHPPLGQAICQLETGIVAGVLETIYPDKRVVGREKKCIGGLGDDVCLMEYTII